LHPVVVDDDTLPNRSPLTPEENLSLNGVPVLKRGAWNQPAIACAVEAHKSKPRIRATPAAVLVLEPLAKDALSA
jgi:hypothetical protein